MVVVPVRVFAVMPPANRHVVTTGIRGKAVAFALPCTSDPQ